MGDIYINLLPPVGVNKTDHYLSIIDTLSSERCRNKKVVFFNATELRHLRIRHCFMMIQSCRCMLKLTGEIENL